MFERYTEGARRVIWFARDEAMHRGSGEIIPADIALAVMREAKDSESVLAGRWDEMQSLLRTWPACEQSADRDVPLSNASKRVLAYANEEHLRDGAHFIQSEHLLRGVLREGDAVAKKLSAAGLNLQMLRKGSPAAKGTRSRFGSRDRRKLWFLRWWLIGAALVGLGAVFYLHSQQ